MNKKAFSFVEMIVVISIIILLAIIGATVNTNLKTKTLNTRSTADLSTLENAFLAYLEENKTLPSPEGNTNYFKEDISYSEPNDNPFAVYGQVTSDTLPNKYLSFLPLDQFTGAFYAYGKLMNGKNEFEVAGVIRESGDAQSIVKGNYAAESGPYNLIREYNGPNFVYDESGEYFPYNPDELALNARITEFTGSVEVNNRAAQVNQVLSEGDDIEIPAGEQATLYFGDGSKSVIGDSSAVTSLTISEMSYPEDGNSLISKVTLVLDAGTIWTNATQMGSSSEFNIQTGDTTAAVRGTIFGVSSNGDIEVVSGTVAKTTTSSPTPINITSSNSDNVPSINTEIDKGTGELSSTLKTEIVSYDSETNTVTLKINNVFKYDAEYLKAGDNIDIHQNRGAWDINNTGEQEFDLTDINGNSIDLSFCKMYNGYEVCTRETSIASNLSYVTEEVTGGPRNCESITIGLYEVFALDSGNNRNVEIEEEIENGDKTTTQNFECNNGIFMAQGDEEIDIECDDGYDEDTDICTPKTKTFSDYIKDGFEYDEFILTYSRSINVTSTNEVVNSDHELEKKTLTLTLKADGVTEDITDQSISFEGCDSGNGYIGDSNGCSKAVCQITGSNSNVPSNGWYDSPYDKEIEWGPSNKEDIYKKETITGGNGYKKTTAANSSCIIDENIAILSLGTQTSNVSCNNGYDYTVDNVCIKNNLGGDWKVVKYLENPGSTLNLASLGLGSNFAFEFDSNNSQDTSSFESILKINGGFNIEYIKNDFINRLYLKNGLDENVKTGDISSNNIDNIFKLQGTGWNLSMNGQNISCLSTSCPGVPNNVTGRILEISNIISKIKIYKK